ncbi:MAG: NAD(P)-dependent oxidoreductase [Desulfovibrio sp.]
MARHIIEEAKRCLQCKRPLCTKGCPISTPVNEMIRLFLGGEIQKAGELLFKNNPLSVVCSLICPHENFCEGHCILGKKKTAIQVSAIENYISSYYLEKIKLQKDTPKGRVAVIGSGPSGITVAFILAQAGYSVTIFEAEEKIGGVLRYGIPDYRLPKKILDRMKDLLCSLGVRIRPNMSIGPVITIDNLFRDGYGAAFIGTGVWSPRPLRIKGESLGHVHYAINYLKNPDVYPPKKKAVIIGAGNVAMDVARTALRKGTEEVTILYRRGEKDIPATLFEYEYAKIDGVKFEFFKSPLEITDEGIRYNRTEYVTDEAGNQTLQTIKDSEAVFKADTIFIAASQVAQSDVTASTEGIKVTRYGLVITDEDGRTSRPGVFASGDAVTGAKTVVEAVNFSKRSAEAIMDFLNS